ncbi:Omp28-related outer membrane protein [Flavobacterium sp.]|jgi:hypothetical protein|uniref:Omp28-related outer membrane protein n=1 Tax=Flavobacterium sp. TaxID=239 RepID=UPI0037C0B0EB
MKSIKTFFFFLLISSLNSCYQDTGDFFRTDSIILTADFEEKRPGQTINFKIVTDSGIDITNEAKIFIQEITTPPADVTMSDVPSLTSLNLTSYKVYAKYSDINSNKAFTSNEIIVKFDNKKSFVKRVLIEDYTGAWCVSCPRVSYAIELLKLSATKMVPVAIHIGGSPGSFDPYNFVGVEPLFQLVNFTGEYPTGKLNRMTPWPFAQNSPTNQNIAIALTAGKPVRLGLSMNSVIENNAINLNVKVKFYDDYSNLKLVVYVLENNLIYPQKNNTPFYGGLSLIPNFEHDHVVRGTFTNLLGDAIPSGETYFENIYSKNFSVDVSTLTIENLNNLEFVAFVVGSDNKAINVRSAQIGENQLDFDENP